MGFARPKMWRSPRSNYDFWQPRHCQSLLWTLWGIWLLARSSHCLSHLHRTNTSQSRPAFAIASNIAWTRPKTDHNYVCNWKTIILTIHWNRMARKNAGLTANPVWSFAMRDTLNRTAHVRGTLTNSPANGSEIPSVVLWLQSHRTKSLKVLWACSQIYRFGCHCIRWPLKVSSNVPRNGRRTIWRAWWSIDWP